MISKVISGGQTGSDMAGLLAAKECFITTGGWIPNGFRTENGPKPEYAEEFNLKETYNRNYRTRTLLNVKDSDGTLIIAWNINSSGTKETIEACKVYNKPYYIIDLSQKGGLWDCQHNQDHESVKEILFSIKGWIHHQKIGVLNIAGNRESAKPIEAFAKDMLVKLFKICKN